MSIKMAKRLGSLLKRNPVSFTMLLLAKLLK
jgi:hypothetical protein